MTAPKAWRVSPENFSKIVARYPHADFLGFDWVSYAKSVTDYKLTCRQHAIEHFLLFNKTPRNFCADLIGLHTAAYSKPTRADTAVVLCYFSCVPSLKLEENFNFVREHLRRAQIPHFSAEMVFGANAPAVGADYTFHTDSAMFYKEVLWHLAAAKVPAEYTKLIFIDADVVFLPGDWVDRCSAVLDDCDVAAPMEECLRVPNTHKNSTAFGAKKRPNELNDNFLAYHPGFAAMARRDWLNKVGFFDRALMGSGDVIFWWAVAHAIGAIKKSNFLAAKFGKYVGVEAYCDLVAAHPPRVGYAAGVRAIHTPHGTELRRLYGNRLDFFTPQDFSGVSWRQDGVPTWGNNTRANNAAVAYFAQRNEDGDAEATKKLHERLNSIDVSTIPLRCVSLKRASERREQITLWWQKERGVNFQFFDACDKRDNLVFENGADGGVLPYSDQLAQAFWRRPLSQGERACRLSHYLCAQELLNTAPAAPLYVIFEDDAEPLFRNKKDFFTRVICGFYEHKNIDVLLAHNLWGAFQTKTNGLYSRLLDLRSDIPGPCGTVCMVFSNRGLIKFCASLERCGPADSWRKWSARDTVACLNNNLARHIAETTYVGNSRGRARNRVEIQ